MYHIKPADSSGGRDTGWHIIRADVWAALEVARRPENKGKLIVAVSPDTGERYLSTRLFQQICQPAQNI